MAIRGDGYMYKLFSKLNEICYQEIDIEDFLDQRESEPFDGEWIRVYQDIEELKKDKMLDDTKDIEKKVYMFVFEQLASADLAAYISEDFALIAESKMLNYSDAWLDKLISCYENAKIPCGEL